MPIVEATFVAADVKDGQGQRDKALAHRLEQAMAASIRASQELGITDPVVIKERLIAAYRAERAK